MTTRDNYLIFLSIKYRVHTDTVFLFSHLFYLQNWLVLYFFKPRNH